MIIEFIGSPGSGKSTVAKAICLNKQFKIHDYSQALERIYASNSLRLGKYIGLLPRNIRNRMIYSCGCRVFHEMIANELVVHHLNFFSCLLELLENFDERDNIISLFRNGLEKMIACEKTAEKNELIVHDEGLLQYLAHIMSGYESLVNYKKIPEFFLLIRKPHILIHVSADDSLCLARQKNRGGYVYSFDVQKKYTVNSRLIAKWCEQEIPVVYLSGNCASTETLDQVCKEILRIRENMGGR